MSYVMQSLAALALLSGASAVSASDINSAASIGSNAFSESVATYPISPVSAENRRKMVLQKLDRVCSSNRRGDQRRCDRAWRIINDAHAELQARRAAEASGGIANP